MSGFFVKEKQQFWFWFEWHTLGVSGYPFLICSCPL